MDEEGRAAEGGDVLGAALPQLHDVEVVVAPAAEAEVYELEDSEEEEEEGGDEGGEGGDDSGEGAAGPAVAAITAGASGFAGGAALPLISVKGTVVHVRLPLKPSYDFRAAGQLVGFSDFDRYGLALDIIIGLDGTLLAKEYKLFPMDVTSSIYPTLTRFKEIATAASSGYIHYIGEVIDGIAHLRYLQATYQSLARLSSVDAMFRTFILNLIVWHEKCAKSPAKRIEANFGGITGLTGQQRHRDNTNCIRVATIIFPGDHKYQYRAWWWGNRLVV